MGSSPGFGSARRDPHPSRGACALFGLAFAVRTDLRGPDATTSSNSTAHSSIGTRSTAATRAAILSLTVDRRFQGLFHSPRRGTFHLSLTVLVRYRSLRVFSLGGWAPQVPAGLHVSRGTHDATPGRIRDAAYGAVTRSGRRFHAVRPARIFVTSRGPGRDLRVARPTPGGRRPAGHSVRPVWAPPRSLATTDGISVISVPRGTEMFQFPRCPPRLTARCPGMTRSGFPHSGISGSTLVGSSPEPFVAYHALRRHAAPRHPPSALIRFFSSLCSSALLLPPLLCSVSLHADAHDTPPGAPAACERTPNSEVRMRPTHARHARAHMAKYRISPLRL